MTLSIRRATKVDLPGVLALYAQPDIDDGETLELNAAHEIYDRFVLYPDYRLYVAVTHDQIVGSFALLIMDNLGHLGAPSAIVEDVVVDPVRQGQGIGTQMMELALDEARRHGCYKAMLSSNMKREKAHAFYAGLGFARHGYSFLVQLEGART